MVIVIDDEKLLRNTKKIAIFLLVIAGLLFLVLSGMIFKFSQEEPLLYERNYVQMNTSGQVMVSSMRKTGEVEDSILNNKNAFRNTKKKGKKNAFFDSVSNNHKSDKNKK